MLSQAFTRGASSDAADYRSSLRRRGLGRVAVGALATVGAVVMAMATPAAAIAAPDPIPTYTDPGPPPPVVYQHTNLKDCDQIAPTGDTELLTSGGITQDQTVAGVGSGTLTDNQTKLDVHILTGHSVTAIIVKGGDNSNVYFFDPAVAGEAFFLHLNAPTNGGGNENPTISHWLVCGGDPTQEPPPPSYDVTSEVHLTNNAHTVVDNANPATAPADVHDSIIVTVSGLEKWSATLTVSFYKSAECTGDVVDSVSIPITEGTTMPQDNVLPQTGLAAGSYSYKDVVTVGPDGDQTVKATLCEPFKVVDGPTNTPSPSPSLPKTGDNVGSFAITGAVLLAAGAAMIGFLFVTRRRRSAAERNS